MKQINVQKLFHLKTRSYILLNIISAFVVAGVLVFIIMKWLDYYTRHGEAVTVPVVEDMTLAQGLKQLKQNGLEGVVSDSIYVRDREGGIILDVNPPAGSKVKEGRTIYITINTNNIPLVSLPDVIDNSSARQARALMSATGFKLTENELIPGERDWVYGVKYNDRELLLGEKVPIGATLTLMVGSGEKELPEDSLELDTDSLGNELSEVEPNEKANDTQTVHEDWF